jgi:hypothetical protein
MSRGLSRLFSLGASGVNGVDAELSPYLQGVQRFKYAKLRWSFEIERHCGDEDETTVKHKWWKFISDTRWG